MLPDFSLSNHFLNAWKKCVEYTKEVDREHQNFSKCKNCCFPTQAICGKMPIGLLAAMASGFR